MSYICLSHAAADQPLADRFARELTRYGFSFQCIDETTPVDKRESIYTGARFLLLLTSFAAEIAGSCATDLRRAAGVFRPCICVSLGDNGLDRRFCASAYAIPLVPYPAGETDTPDERAVALFIHRLYIKHLAALSDCFSPVRCADDAYGRAIVLAHKAHRGDAEAQFLLGRAYEAGVGLPMLEEEAARWITKSAGANYTDALIRLGELRLDGKGVERDAAEALRLFSRAAKLGDARGQFAKGICCLYGYGLMKDPEMALRYFRAAANAGYVPALYRIGLLYRDGLGTPADHRRAVKYLYKAATGRDEFLPYLYGKRFASRAEDEKDTRKRKYVCVSMRFMQQKKLDQLLKNRVLDHCPSEASDKALIFGRTHCVGHRTDYPENAWLQEVTPQTVSAREGDYSHRSWSPGLAESALGKLLEKGSEKDGIYPAPRAALLWYRRAVRHGYPGAIFRLGDAYRSGRGVPKDSEQAVRLFRRAAELGSRRGQFAMGVCCEQGEGLPRDPVAAVAWYEQAAQNGYAPAQNNLGGCYEYGIGVEEDPLAAVEWYTRASAEGEPNATCRLAQCYENGRGVTRSPERAFRLYETAAKHSHPFALYRLALYYDRGYTVPTQVAYAAHLYERAALGGVGDAAYAMALCCAEGRGVRRSSEDSVVWLKRAAALGSVQGAYALGMAYLEGRVTVQNKEAAEAAFRQSAAVYEAMSRRARSDADQLYPMDGLSLTEAAGKALYMLGYLRICNQGKDGAADAMNDFIRSATIGCREAMTAIGDMYTDRMVLAEDSEKQNDIALVAYEAAADKRQIEALLSLATQYEAIASAAESEGRMETALKMREKALKCLTEGTKEGSLYAMVGLSGCHWFGYGAEPNRRLAYEYLCKLDQMQKNGHPLPGNTMGALWLGDICWFAVERLKMSEDVRKRMTQAAYNSYVKSTAAPYTPAEGTDYVLPMRREKRWNSEARAKAEAQYRLAVLSMMYFKDQVTAHSVYDHMGAAVLAMHSQALDDLTRLFRYEKYVKAQAPEPVGKKKRKKTSKQPAEVAKAEITWDFGEAYYGVLRPLPEPFTLSAPVNRRSETELPECLNAPLTDTHRAEALNHLGDRYFYGQGIREDQSAAVACYRRAASVVQPRGEKVSGGIVWAQYSLGYCLLHGIGTHKDPREAVRWLEKAAKNHGEASLCLAVCHESGLGVDRKDRLEALKYYRRASKLGCAAAEDEIDRLEAEIKEES